MSAIKNKGTKPERQLWSILAQQKIRGWEKNPNDIIGKPDVLFRNLGIAIFIDGCFWHHCPKCKKKIPQNNHIYWEKENK